MRILLTNDDGIDAPGFAVLEAMARTLSDDVWVVAPEREQSGVSRAVTLHTPLRVKPCGDKRFACSGTPGDCVLIGVREIMRDTPPDLVLSGVNRGQNLAEDVTLSGTVAGALKGTALGIRSIALSQAFTATSADEEDQKGTLSFDAAAAWGPRVLRMLLAQNWAHGVTMNVNFPSVAPDAVTGVEVTRQGARDVMNVHAEMRTDLRGFEYYWLGFRAAKLTPPAGTDLHAVYHGAVSVTPLFVDLTHEASLASLRLQMSEAAL
jgi:5'-nucleotidase